MSEGSLSERKVLKVDMTEPDMDAMQTMPQDDMNMGGGQAMPDEQNVDMGNSQEEMPNQFDTNFDAGVEADEETDPKRYIQQLAGKLSQSLRSYNSELPSPDTDLNKYVAGMINKQALEGMNPKDVNDVLSKIKGDEDENNDSIDTGEEQAEPDINQNESVNRNVINELFQELVGGDDNTDNQIADKPITNIGYKKKPFTSPTFK